jgi:hypothetical protein
MKHIVLSIVTAGLAFLVPSTEGFARDASQMMAKCNTYAAHHLRVSTSDIAEVKYEGQRTDGTHAVNGTTTSGQTFQCSFNRAGSHVVGWFHSAPKGCPADVSEADRYRYPDCN